MIDASRFKPGKSSKSHRPWLPVSSLTQRGERWGGAVIILLSNRCVLARSLMFCLKRRTFRNLSFRLVSVVSRGRNSDPLAQHGEKRRHPDQVQLLPARRRWPRCLYPTRERAPDVVQLRAQIPRVSAAATQTSPQALQCCGMVMERVCAPALGTGPR